MTNTFCCLGLGLRGKKKKSCQAKVYHHKAHFCAGALISVHVGVLLKDCSGGSGRGVVMAAAVLVVVVVVYARISHQSVCQLVFCGLV